MFAADIAETTSAPCVLATGANAPPSPHSVLVSLPTLASVVGYETGDPAVTRLVSAGYPRFVEGALLAAVQDALASRLVSAGCSASLSVVLVASPASAACMLAWARARLPSGWLEEGAAAAVPGEALLAALEKGEFSPGGGGGWWVRAVEACGGWACGSGDGGEALRRGGGGGGGWAAVLLPRGALPAACAYQQHTGCRLSTRAAEQLGLRLGLWGEGEVVRHGEGGGGGGGSDEALLEAQVRAAFPPAGGAVEEEGAPVALSSGGMATVCAVLGAVQAVHAAAACAPPPAGGGGGWGCPAHPGCRLRDTWLQLGWLYLDTQRAFEHFAAPPCAECDRLEAAPPPGARLLRVFDVYDRPAWESLIARHGARLAGVITEAPTNPLLATVDLSALRGAVDAHAPGAALVVDPTLAGLGALNPLPFADAVVLSLTKYVGSGGDVMGGAVALNPHTGVGRALVARLLGALPPPAPARAGWNSWCSPFLPLEARPPPLSGRDLRRLAACAVDTARVVAGGAAACAALAAWLRFFAPGGGGPRLLRAVHTARSSAVGAANCDALGARAPLGSVLTLELADTWPGGEEGRPFDAEAAAAALARFYDALPCVKAPSFGCAFTNACPFLYLVRVARASFPPSSTVPPRHTHSRHALNHKLPPAVQQAGPLRPRQHARGPRAADEARAEPVPGEGVAGARAPGRAVGHVCRRAGRGRGGGRRCERGGGLAAAPRRRKALASRARSARRLIRWSR
jgi:hypothetical protein